MFGRILVCGITLLLIGMASPSGVRPTPALAAAAQTRIFSCAGFDFHPVDQRTSFRWANRQIYRDDHSGDGWFYCAASLPHTARVTKVRFTVIDDSASAGFEYCGLVRVPLSINGAKTSQLMGLPLSGTSVSGRHGTIRPAISSINYPVIDNANFAYTLQCRMVLKESVAAILTDEFGLIGADVTYTIDPANG